MRLCHRKLHLSNFSTVYFTVLYADKETDFDGNVTVTIKGDGQDANDAKREILDLISSNANRSDGNSRGQDSRNYNQNRDSRGRGNDSWGNDQMSNSRGRDSRSFDQSQSSRGRDSSSHDQTRNSQRGYESQSNRFEDKLEIYPDKVGAVIGRQGATINELQSNFKVRVNIDKTTNYNGRATVTVSGDRDNVKAAIDSIKELVGEPQMNDAPPQNRNEPEPMEYEAIDWQAAARESVSKNMIGIHVMYSNLNESMEFTGRRKQKALGQVSRVAEGLL